MNIEEDEEYGLNQDDLDRVYQSMDEVLSGKSYDDRKSGQLINDILEKVMETLYNLKKPYKYITNCMVAQRMGNGLSNFTSAYYDKDLDNVYHLYYPGQKGSEKDRPQIFGLLTIFCISYSTK